MENSKNIQSVLKLDKMLFDKIEFKRLGFQGEGELEIEMQSRIARRNEENIYKVSLLAKGNKSEEYTFEICLTGYFSIEMDAELSEELKEVLIAKNSVAILMPYLRSEVSLLTAQPGVECVVLPPFNINNMLESK